MEKTKKQIIFLNIFLICFIGVVILFSYRIYSSSKKTLAEQFNNQQLLLANEVSSGIEKFFQEMIKKMELFAVAPSVAEIKTEYQEKIRVFYEQEKEYIRFLGVADRKGELIYYTSKSGYGRIEKNRSKTDYFTRVKAIGHSLIVMDYFNKKGPAIIMVVPLAVKRKGLSDEKSYTGSMFNGAIILEVELNRIIRNFIHQIKSGEHGFAWLLDKSGILLAHSKHPEMIKRNIFRNERSCFACHYSFSIEKDMAEGGYGVGKYRVRGAPENFIAYAPIHIEDNLWSVGVVASVSEVEELLKVNLRNTLILVFLVIFSSAAGTFLLVRVNARRVLLEEKERASREVLRAKIELQAIFDGITDGITLIDKNMVIRNTNMAFARMFNKLPEEIIGNVCYKELKKGERMCTMCPVEQTLRTGNPSSSEEILERDDGSKFYADVTAFPLRNENGEIIQIIEYVKDTTEQRKIKARLDQSEQLASIGVFASALAHEVKNPLNSINLQLTLLERRISKASSDVKSEAAMLIDIIRNEIGRLNRLTEEFLLISKTSKKDFAEGDINYIIDETLKLVELEANDKNVIIVRDYNKIPFFSMNQGKIKQVFLNIIHNSLDAMPKGGELGISTFFENEEAVIVVKDTGVGIEDGEKIFDMFYSTKANGTGLGLAIAQKIIEEHSGRISFESKTGKGTIFRIILPVKI